MWKVLASRTVNVTKQFNITVETLELPDGKQIEWVRHASDDNAAMVIAEQDGKILLQREFSYPQQIELIDFPGGGIMAGEDIKEGANREFTEEAGYRAGQLELIGEYLPERRRSLAKMYVFAGSNLTPATLPGDDSEIIEIFWATPDEIDTMIKKGEIVSPRVLSGWLLYKLKKLNS